MTILLAVLFAAVWLVLSVLAALGFGRMVRIADRQVTR